MPTWGARHDRPRILVEGATQWHATEAADAAGLRVLACPGPGRNDRCPALAGDPCPLVTGADVVVLSHPPDDPVWAALRAAHPHIHPGVPICIETGATGTSHGGEIAVGPDEEDDVVAVVGRVARSAEESEG
jgi:hypothetical protein